MSEQEQVAQIKETHKEAILAKPNVVGVGVGYKVTKGQATDQLAIVTLVSKKLPQVGLLADNVIPRSIEGVPIDVLEVGELRALQLPTDRWRPAPGGVSLGHFKITAGTLGVLVKDRATGARLILSNNHVMANCNDARVGDPVLQPGPADGGQNRSDTIALLERFHPIDFGTAPAECSLAIRAARLINSLAQLLGSQHRVRAYQDNPAASNVVDAAVARPTSAESVLDEILQIGPISGTAPAQLGMHVRKSGRTTGLTTGTISILHATVTIDYGSGRTARFEEQIITSPMSSGGDSGSLLVDANSPRAVGLLFAGSEQTTIHNPIQDVLDTLEVLL
jgi:hypothetical protein